MKSCKCRLSHSREYVHGEHRFADFRNLQIYVALVRTLLSDLMLKSITKICLHGYQKVNNSLMPDQFYQRKRYFLFLKKPQTLWFLETLLLPAASTFTSFILKRLLCYPFRGFVLTASFFSTTVLSIAFLSLGQKPLSAYNSFCGFL